MSVCLVGSWAKVPNGDDALEMAENIFLNRDNAISLPKDRAYLSDFREKHPEVKAAFVDGIDQFDDQFFSTGESEAICMDPQQRMLMQGVVKALENAGITIEMASEAKCSVYTAAWAYDYKDLLPPDQYMATGNSASVMCGRITYFLNSRGAAVGIETACSSSLVAFHLARQAILNGDTNLALVCGANHIGSRSFHSLYNSHMVSPNGRLAAFDRSANGFVRAESFAVAVLCSQKFTIDNGLNVLCECTGSAFNSDGKTPSLTAPNPIAQHEVQLEAMKNMNINDIQLVTCHGTGTKLGDQIELVAIKKSFKPDIRIMSPKSSLCHGEGAAGLIGVLQSLYSMQHSLIPNQLHLQIPSEELNEQTSMVFVNEESELNKVAISSYGFGGTNACAILEKPKKLNIEVEKYSESKVLFLSAKSMESLKLKIQEYYFFMNQTDSILEDILFTENERKTKFDIRAAVFGKSREEMVANLKNNQYYVSSSTLSEFEIEFGEGNEKLWLLRLLYETNKTFQKIVDKYCGLAEACGFPEARTALFFPFKLTLTPLTYNISRLISSMATYKLLETYETLPTKLKGNGIGIIFALAAGNVIKFEEAVLLIKAMIAETDMRESLESISLKTSKVPIQITNQLSKKLTIDNIISELKLISSPSLMTFRVNGEEIVELDPIVKVQKTLCKLFVSGYEPKVTFRGSIVKTPGYSFLKRKFWPEMISIDEACATKNEKTEETVDSNNLYETVKEIVKKFLDLDEDDVNLLETGAVDSLTSIEMVEAIGSAVNHTMPFDLLETNPTTQLIVEYLKSLVQNNPKKTTLKESESKKPTEFDENVAVNVISADFMFAGVDGEKELWDKLLTSKLLTQKMTETRKKQCEGDVGLDVGLVQQDISLFDNSFFSIAKDEAEFIDPQHRLLLHSAYNALEKSGFTSLPDSDLYLAINSHSEYRSIAEKHIEELDERLWMGTVHSMAAGRLAALLGVRGKAVLVDTTCSSIASALEMGIQSIRNGKKFAVIATTHLIQSSKWLYSLRSLLAPESTKSFDMNGSGFCRSDGVGVIILKPKEDGDTPLLSINNASAVHSGAVVTPVVGTISQLLENCGDISYIEGHGTATMAGDSSESMAYQKLGKEVIMSSVKAQFGHCEVASGLIQLMKVACLSKNGMIPSIVHNALPNEHIRHNDKIRLPFVGEEYNIDRSAIVSFGITGTKTVVTTKKVTNIIEESYPTCCFLPISAKTKDGLRKMAQSFIEMLETSNESLYDISKMMQKQKINFKWRSVVVASDHSKAIKQFKKFLTSEEKNSTQNWHVYTAVHSIGCSTFFKNIDGFEKHYISFCNRLRFEPFSDEKSIYHVMSVVFSLVKTIIEQEITNSFVVSGFNSLIVLAAIDAAPTHYFNDLIHAFANNDARMMKRIARDVTIQVENIDLFNLNGEIIKTARQAVDAAIETTPPSPAKLYPENCLILSPNNSFEDTEPLQTVMDYYRFIGEKYIKGMAISFTEIFGKPKKIVDLPEYPFNRKSFWLPIKETQPTIVSNLAISSSKISAKTEYEFLLNSDEWKHVRNHVVDSQIVLPGATSIRLVFELYSHPTICLQNIDFLNKIIPKETPMKINQRKDEEIWILSCEDQDAISFKISELDDKLIEILPYQIVHAETKNADEIYHRFSLSQLTYRNEFQMLDNIKFNIGKGEAHFVPIHNIDVLIDGTLQAIVLCYFFENSEDHTPFVPFTIDTISIFNANIKQKQLHASLKYESSNVFIIGSATVYDEFENIILHIEKVSFKRLNGKTSQPSSGVSKAVINMKTRKSAVSQQAKKEAQKILHLWFEDNFGWSDIDDSTGFFDLGLTSIQAVKLRNVIKSNYPDASTTCIFDYPSVDELSTYLSSLDVPIGAETSEKMTNSESEVDDINNETEDEPIEQTRLSLYPVGVMSAACRLPGGISCPSEFWELLKIGKNASSRIPAHRISTRNNLIAGTKYGNSVEGGNFITQDVTQFDPAFFKISKSEAELIDPQQRILLECVQECLENSGVTETNDVGVFVGLMEKEYQDMMESSSILSMLGSMAAVIAGRVNYVFGCHGPSVTIDTACSSSLVALEMGVNALLDKRCSKALVAGVNLILNERGQGLRANGKMLSQHGMSLSFDSRASGYGRSDGCVVLMLELAKPTFHYMSTIQSVNVNHGGRSVSLTAPNGMAHKMLLTSVINQSPSLMIDYWEAHGTGTPLGDPIEFNTLSSILQNIIVGSVKASLGHGEASAGTCGLLKLFLMLTNQYVPTLIHFHVLNKDINAGSLRLPIIGEEADLSSAGISSFGVSGTNAAAIAFNDNNKLEPYTLIHKYYILPISAKNQNSLDKLENEILQMIPLTDIPINHISSGLSNNRSHFAIRNALIVSNSGNIIRKLNGKPQRVAKREKYLIKLSEQILAATLLQFDTINEWFTMASLKTSSSTFALKYALTKFVLSISQYIQIVATDSTDLIAILLANDTLNWNTFDMKLIDLPVGSLLNELAEQNLNGLNDANIKNYQIQPESIILENHIDLLNMIMVLYTKGYDIDWSTIYSPIQKHINLPNYQFNRQTLWFEDKKNVFEHYLIGTIEEQTEKCLVLKNMISELRHPQLFNGKPIDVGTIIEIAVQAMKVTNSVPFSIQNLKTTQISLNKPVWLKTLIEQEHTEEDNNENNGGYSVKAFVDDKLLFSLTASVFESESVELPVVEVTIPDCTIHLPDCPNTIIRKNRNMVYVNSEAEVSPFRTSNLVLNEIIGFTPNPSDMFIEVFGNFPAEYFVVQVDDGALWQFQIISKEKHVLSNVYVLKDATGIEMPIVRMHKKSTLLSSQEAYNIAQKTLQLDIISKVKSAFNDVIDSGLEIDESQMSTGFSELGMDSLATVDLLNRLNQKYFPDIELTTSDLFDNPNIIDLAIRIEELLKENNIEQLESTPPTPKLSMRERKLSIPAKRHQELAQIEFVDRYNQKEMEMKKDEENKSKKNSIEKPSVIDRDDIRRKISSAVLDLATESINAEDINTKGFSELGMDSLSIVDFVNRLNEKYFPDEEINTSDVFDYPTVNELTDLITRKKSLSAGVNPVSINERDGIVKEQKSVEKNISIEDDETNTDDILLSQSYILVPNDIVNFESDYTMQTNQSSELILIDSKSTSQKPIVVLTDISQNEQIFLSIFKSSKKILINFESFHKTVNYLYLSLLNFVKTLSKLKLSCEIFVPSTSTLANYISKAFFKTVSSEKYPSIKYIWDQNIQQLSFKENRHFNVKGSWLITGGLSGIGFEIGRYLSNNGAENVILVSRREPTVEVQRDIATWKAKVHTIASDVCDKNKLIQHLEKINVNVTSIIHSAGVLKDGKIERQTNLFFEQVFKPKAEGFLVLEEIENYFNYKIENFIVMSSFTAACGNEGQLNYGVANAFLEYQILQRQKAGKSGCAIQWGNWIDTGMATNAHVRNFLADLGFLGQHNEDALKYLKLCIEKKPVIIMVANIDWKRILKNRKDLPRELVNQGVLPFDSLRKEDSLKRIESENVNEEDEEDILDSLKQKISDMTKLPISKLKNKTNIMDIGLDSRLIAVLIADINTIFKISLNLSDTFNYSTIEKLASAIWEKLENQKVLNTNQEAKDDSNVNKITVKNNDFCPLLGMNIFFDDMEDFEKVKLQAEKNILSGLVNPKTSGKFSLPVIGKSMDEIVGKIQNGATQQVKECKKVSKSVMLLTGQGSQYPMMGRQLIEHYDIFRTTLEYCLDKCDSYLNGDIKLWNILFDTENYSQLQFTKHMQPIMFSFGYAAAQLWKALNVIPDFYLGHSVGELVAGVLAGIMSIDDGLKLIVERGKAMENIAGLGALLAVQREIADDVLRKFQVSVATVNSPKQVVFAGVKDELDKALAYVKGKGKQGTFVNQKYPFHSNLIQESHLIDLRKCLKTIAFSTATTPIVSNITGNIIDTFSEEYIVKHTVSAVNFVSCIETLINENVNVWIDAGPASVLATFIKRIIPPANISKHQIVQTCKEKESDIETLLQSCLELEQSGISINWRSMYGLQEDKQIKIVDFPSSQKFNISDEEMEVLKDHCVNNKIIIAGAYQLYKLDQFISQKTDENEEKLILKNVKFLKPWWYEKDGKEFEIKWNADMTIELIVQGDPVCFSKISVDDKYLPREQISEKEKTFDVHEFYENLFANGLQYYEGFRRIDEAKRSDKKCFAKLLPSKFPWTLIDSTMHSITASVVVKRPDFYFLPVAMSSVSISDCFKQTSTNFTSQAIITSETDKFIQVNLVLFSGEKVILEIRNMTIVVMKLDDNKKKDVEKNEINNEVNENGKETESNIKI